MAAVNALVPSMVATYRDTDVQEELVEAVAARLGDEAEGVRRQCCVNKCGQRDWSYHSSNCMRE